MENDSNSFTWEDKVHQTAHGIRCRLLRLTIERNGCYLSQALSSAEILSVLYTHVLRLGPSLAPVVPPPFCGVPGHAAENYLSGSAYHGQKSSDLDRLIISPAHYAAAVYAALVEVGRMAPEGMNQFNLDGSTVEMIGAEHSPGFELTTGSFGQALSQAGGIAMAKRLRGESGRVFVFMSDGEMQEGQTWEAVQALAFYKLDNLIACIDINGQQVDGKTSEVMNIEPISSRLEAFGAKVFRVDGHNIIELANALNQKAGDGRPFFVLAYTNSSQGIPLLDDRKPKLHFVRFKDAVEIEQYKAWLERMEAERG